MGSHFVKALLDRMLSESRPDEDFFSAGPSHSGNGAVHGPARQEPRQVATLTVSSSLRRQASGV